MQSMGICMRKREIQTDRKTNRQNPGTDKEFLHGARMEADKS